MLGKIALRQGQAPEALQRAWASQFMSMGGHSISETSGSGSMITITTA